MARARESAYERGAVRMLDNHRFAGTAIEAFNCANRDERRREVIPPNRGWSLGAARTGRDRPNHIDRGANRQDLCTGASHGRMISARPGAGPAAKRPTLCNSSEGVIWRFTAAGRFRCAREACIRQKNANIATKKYRAGLYSTRAGKQIPAKMGIPGEWRLRWQQV
jgi:hypothetical protein